MAAGLMSAAADLMAAGLMSATADRMAAGLIFAAAASDLEQMMGDPPIERELWS